MLNESDDEELRRGHGPGEFVTLFGMMSENVTRKQMVNRDQPNVWGMLIGHGGEKIHWGCFFQDFLTDFDFK